MIRALPGGDRPLGDGQPVGLGPDGSVTVGENFRLAEASWYQGLAAIGRAGTGLIIDEVFLSGWSSQERLAVALRDLTVLWVGVRCAPEVAAIRERRRPDRVPGMAATQAGQVHGGVHFDLVVDTTCLSPLDCAHLIAERLGRANLD